jgi:hypothetical protein
MKHSKIGPIVAVDFRNSIRDKGNRLAFVLLVQKSIELDSIDVVAGDAAWSDS